MKKLLWPVLVSGALLAPAAFAQEPQSAPLPPECQGMQVELNARMEMQSSGTVAPTAPAYLAWLQQQIDACKHRQGGSDDAPGKSRETMETLPDGHISTPSNGQIPEPIDWSHLDKNPPRPPDGAKNGRDRDKADNLPPTSWDMRSRNWLPPVRNQNPFGTCVSHAAIGAAESNAISPIFPKMV